ncbi:hypothetical protein GCM10027589_55060 [Actinocorallia lasiicapitis]
MLVRGKVLLVAVAVAAGSLAGATAAQAGVQEERAAACSVPQKFSRVIELPGKGSVHAPTRKHPGGWVRGQYMKIVDDGVTEPHWTAYGKRHTRYFAKKPVVCLLLAGPRNQILKKSSLKGLRKQVATGKTSWQYGLVIKKNRIVKIVQLWRP